MEKCAPEVRLRAVFATAASKREDSLVDDKVRTLISRT